mmetsp:Transcript_32331/g.78616  ORF Transcript_32331/g.78616 Transcript_32331/m.78616 type:complete len:226 (+) Transcript_32331:626-1303(+)
MQLIVRGTRTNQLDHTCRHSSVIICQSIGEGGVGGYDFNPRVGTAQNGRTIPSGLVPHHHTLDSMFRQPAGDSWIQWIAAYFFKAKRIILGFFLQPFGILPEFRGILCRDTAPITVTIADNGAPPHGGSVLQRHEGFSSTTGKIVVPVWSFGMCFQAHLIEFIQGVYPFVDIRYHFPWCWFGRRILKFGLGTWHKLHGILVDGSMTKKSVPNNDRYLCMMEIVME